MPRYCTTDPNWRVVMLTRAGHHLWRLRSRKSLHARQQTDIDAALELIWQCKREVKAELADKRAARTRTLNLTFGRIEAQDGAL